MPYDFTLCGWRIGPVFVRDETLYRIHGWWPPEARRRREMAVRATRNNERAKLERDAYLKGHEDGWNAYRKQVSDAFEKTFGSKL